MQELAPTPPRVGLVLQYLQERPTSPFWGKFIKKKYIYIIKRGKNTSPVTRPSPQNPLLLCAGDVLSSLVEAGLSSKDIVAVGLAKRKRQMVGDLSATEKRD